MVVSLVVIIILIIKIQAEWSGLAMAERNYETVPALRGEAVWETKLDQGNAYDDGHGHGHGHGHEVYDGDDDDDDNTEITLF